MSSNLYPDLIKRLKEAGCTYERDAKGSHEIWHSPITNRSVSVPKNTKVVHTANKILKDAGAPKAF